MFAENEIVCACFDASEAIKYKATAQPNKSVIGGQQQIRANVKTKNEKHWKVYWLTHWGDPTQPRLVYKWCKASQAMTARTSAVLWHLF